MPTTPAAGTVGRQFLAFRLADKEYGLDLPCVQEIKGYLKAAPQPNGAPAVRGVMDLRGTVVPVLDLRARLGLRVVADTRFTVVLVVAQAARVAGLVVDAVSDVLDIDGAELAPAPDSGAGAPPPFVTALARAGDRSVTLLNVGRLLAPTDDAYP